MSFEVILSYVVELLPASEMEIAVRATFARRGCFSFQNLGVDRSGISSVSTTRDSKPFDACAPSRGMNTCRQSSESTSPAVWWVNLREFTLTPVSASFTDVSTSSVAMSTPTIGWAV